MRFHGMAVDFGNGKFNIANIANGIMARWRGGEVATGIMARWRGGEVARSRRHFPLCVFRVVVLALFSKSGEVARWRPRHSSVVSALG